MKKSCRKRRLFFAIVTDESSGSSEILSLFMIWDCFCKFSVFYGRFYDVIRKG